MNKITNILEHDITWFADKKAVKELDEATIEYIETCIKDGITQGELNICYGKKNGQRSLWVVENN